MTQRVLVGVTAALEWTNLNQDGTPAAASGALTAKVERADGTTVLPAGTATTPGAGTGAYLVTLTAAQNDRLDRLKVTWTDGSAHVTYHEVVGAFYLTEPEMRGLDARFATGASPEIAAADLRRVRGEVEDAIEAEAGAAFVRRYARETVSGHGGSALLLPHTYPRTVRSVRSYTDAATYTAWSASELAAITVDPSGLLGLWSGAYTRGTRNLVVEYEHGLDYPPNLIRRAARALFKVRMLDDLATADPTLANVRSLSVEGYSVSYRDGGGTGSKTADDLIDQWKRSTNPAGVALA